MTEKAKKKSAKWAANDNPVLTVKTFRAGKPAVYQDLWKVEGGFHVVTASEPGLTTAEGRGRTHKGSLADALLHDKELLHILWDARTIIVVNAPLVDPQWLQDALTLDDTFHPVGHSDEWPVMNVEEFAEALNTCEGEPEWYFEANWDAETLPCWPVVIYPAVKAVGELWNANEKFLVAGVRVRADESHQPRQRFSPVLLRESSDGESGIDLVVCGVEWASQGWFNDSGSSGPVSWEGGSQLISVGRGVFVDHAYGDFENHLRAVRLPDTEPSTAGTFVAEWVVNQQLEQLLAISGVFDDESKWVLSAEEIQRYSDALEGMYQYSSVGISAPPEVKTVCLTILADMDGVTFVRQFFTDSRFEYREHILRMLEDSVEQQGLNPLGGGQVDAAYLAKEYTDALENNDDNNVDNGDAESLNPQKAARANSAERARLAELAELRDSEGRHEDAETLRGRIRRLTER